MCPATYLDLEISNLFLVVKHKFLYVIGFITLLYRTKYSVAIFTLFYLVRLKVFPKVDKLF